MKKKLAAIIYFIGFSISTASAGPLSISTANPRYFTDGKKIILLTGSHTWNNLVDMSPIQKQLNYSSYLEFLEKNNHNFFRLWAWELTTWDTHVFGSKEPNAVIHKINLLPYLRTGPGVALDGELKFDLKKLNPAYFNRLQSRVKAAQDKGIYVSVMLFEGWGLQKLNRHKGWESNPFNPKNNINHTNGERQEVHTLRHPVITEIQKNYVREIVNTVNSFDNVLYEIANESHSGSTAWQYEMINFIHHLESNKPKQHPVGMTAQLGKEKNDAPLFNSPADWISPSEESYKKAPTAATGNKVIISDTDHLFGIGGSADWVYKTFMSGMNPIFMDTYLKNVLTWSGRVDSDKFPPIRKALGDVRAWSEEINLIGMTPQPNLCSSSYCLANIGKEYLVYFPPNKNTVTIKLPKGNYIAQWFDINSRKKSSHEQFDHNTGRKSFKTTSPSLLHITLNNTKE